MGTTTIRVDTETHAQLLELSRAEGTSLIETVRHATDALRRARFAQQVAAELADLRDDDDRWTSYVADADRSAVADGLG